VSYIEWIYDEYGAAENPIGCDQGALEIDTLKTAWGIGTPAVCGDWLMDFPLLRCTTDERQRREQVLQDMILWAKRISARRIVLPFVDNASIRTDEERATVVGVLLRILRTAEPYGVELHLEADFSPAEFARFLDQLPHRNIKVNYDSGNSSGLGYVAHEEFAAYGDRIGSIHIKDRLRNPDGSVKTMPLGEGSANFDDLFASIRKVGYGGGFTLQAARGDAGDEVNWIRRQAKFVRNYIG
jgi:hexulose-6-phosphate isomerase